MRRSPIPALALAAIGGFGAMAPAPAGAGEPAAQLYEAWFQLEAQHRAAAGRVDVEAAGRLLLRPDPSGRGLELVRVLEAPWKLYAVDLALGGEVKLATEVTLDEPSWAAVDRVRAEVEALAAQRYQAWRASGGARAFDGAFSFLVLGPPEGRFRLRWDPALTVTNRLTDHWLTGELGPHLERWQSGDPPFGYWFWNRGEARPFAWEPHTYHAFAKALGLLGLPSASVTERQALLVAASEVLSTLMPRSRGRFSSAARPQSVVRCRQPVSGAGRPEEETLQLEARTDEGVLSLSVGVQPAGSSAGLRCNAPAGGAASGDVR
jgi:hypothetical protein